MTTKERQEAKSRLSNVIEQWLNETQEGDAPFDLWVGGKTASLMTDAAFSVIEAVDDAHVYLRREGMLKVD